MRAVIVRSDLGAKYVSHSLNRETQLQVVPLFAVDATFVVASAGRGMRFVCVFPSVPVGRLRGCGAEGFRTVWVTFGFAGCLVGGVGVVRFVAFILSDSYSGNCPIRSIRSVWVVVSGCGFICSQDR